MIWYLWSFTKIFFEYLMPLASERFFLSPVSSRRVGCAASTLSTLICWLIHSSLLYSNCTSDSLSVPMHISQFAFFHVSLNNSFKALFPQIIPWTGLFPEGPPIHVLHSRFDFDYPLQRNIHHIPSSNLDITQHSLTKIKQQSLWDPAHRPQSLLVCFPKQRHGHHP